MRVVVINSISMHYLEIDLKLSRFVKSKASLSRNSKVSRMTFKWWSSTRMAMVVRSSTFTCRLCSMTLNNVKHSWVTPLMMLEWQKPGRRLANWVKWWLLWVEIGLDCQKPKLNKLSIRSLAQCSLITIVVYKAFSLNGSSSANWNENSSIRVKIKGRCKRMAEQRLNYCS